MTPTRAIAYPADEVDAWAATVGNYADHLRAVLDQVDREADILERQATLVATANDEVMRLGRTATVASPPVVADAFLAATELTAVAREEAVAVLAGTGRHVAELYRDTRPPLPSPAMPDVGSLPPAPPPEVVGDGPFRAYAAHDADRFMGELRMLTADLGRLTDQARRRLAAADSRLSNLAMAGQHGDGDKRTDEYRETPAWWAPVSRGPEQLLLEAEEAARAMVASVGRAVEQVYAQLHSDLTEVRA